MNGNECEKCAANRSVTSTDMWKRLIANCLGSSFSSCCTNEVMSQGFMKRAKASVFRHMLYMVQSETEQTPTVCFNFVRWALVTQDKSFLKEPLNVFHT